MPLGGVFPGGAYGWGDLMNVLTGRDQAVQQQQADIALTNAKTQIITTQLDNEKRFNAALANMDAARQASDQSVKDMPQDLAAFGGSAMGRPIVDGYRAEAQDAQRNRQLAKVAADARMYDRARQYEQSAVAADGRARDWYAQGLKLQQEQRKEIASTAGSYNPDGSNLQDVVGSINATDPRALNGPQFNRDDQGNIVPGDRTTNAMAALANRNMTRSEQLAAQREADKIKEDGIREERRMKDQQLRERAEDRRAAMAQHTMDVQDKRMARMEQAGAQDSEDIVSSGAMVATGMPMTQAVPGWGTAAVNARAAAKKEAIRQIKEEMGVDDKAAGKELAQRQIDYFAGKRSTTQLNTMLGATRQAVKQLEFNVDQTQKILKDIPSTDLSPLINGIIRKEEQWTGDPRYSSLYFYMHAVAMESARILQGGQASIAQLHQGAAEEAKKWADIGLTPKMFDAVAKSIINEGNARIKTYQDAMSEQRVTGAPSTPAPAAAPAGKTVDWSELK